MMDAVGQRQSRSLAIVIVSLVGGEALKRTLSSIASIDAPRVIIGGSTLPPGSSAQAGAVKFVCTDLPVPLKRAMGLALTDSEWVAFLEDTCDVGPGWHDAIQEIAAEGRFVGAGGPVMIADDLPPRCMALACLEYAAFAPRRARPHDVAAPPAPVVAGRLAGVNLLYRRSAMPALNAATGLIESELNELIQQRGGKLVQHPNLAVTYREADLASATLSSRFSHGRIYGGGQRHRSSAPRRAVALVKCLALPVVMYARASPAIPRNYSGSWRARAWIAVLSLAWSCGEFAGFLAGRGASLARWR